MKSSNNTSENLSINSKPILAELSPLSFKKTKRKNSKNLSKVQKFEQLILNKKKLKKNENIRKRKKSLTNLLYPSYYSIYYDKKIDKEIYLNYSENDKISFDENNSNEKLKKDKKKVSKSFFTMNNKKLNLNESKNKLLNDFDKNLSISSFKKSFKFKENHSKISSIKIKHINQSDSSYSEIVQLQKNIGDISSISNRFYFNN